MPTFQPDFTFTFHPSQRELFREGVLIAEWAKKYPELFDKDDVRILVTEHQKQYHFFEWLSAIKLFETAGYLSLVEKYIAKSHPRKRCIVKSLVDPLFFKWLEEYQAGQPDLFVYHPQTGEWFFCEVKGGRDDIRENQEEWMEKFSSFVNKNKLPIDPRVRIIRLQETAT